MSEHLKDNRKAEDIIRRLEEILVKDKKERQERQERRDRWEQAKPAANNFADFKEERDREIASKRLEQKRDRLKPKEDRS